MTIIEAFVLGIVQGLTEFIPISSSAHLRVVPAFLGWQDPGTAYSAVIQLGSVCAVISYFRHDLWSIFQGTFKALKGNDWKSSDLKIATGILIGTIPICVLGLLFKHLIEDGNGPFRSLITIGVASIVMSLLLFAAEFFGKRKRGFSDISVNDGFLVGLGQALALIPGASRSGSTLTFALFCNLNREDAARFSFLLGIPAITLAGLLELKHLMDASMQMDSLVNLAIGLVTSAIVSYISIAWLLKYLTTHSTWLFIGYRLLFGVTILILYFKHIIQ